MFILSQGGTYPEGSPAPAYDLQMPYLRLIVRFMGITNIEFVYTAATLRKVAFMLEEPLEIGTDEESQQVTAIISHVVRPGREQGYEEWLRGIIAAAKKFKGHRGVSIIQPCDHAHPEYVAILRFDRYTNLKQWLESDVRREWIERLRPLIEKPEEVQTLTGLETWFTLPNKPLKAPPPRYKMALVTWLGVFITLAILSRLLAPFLSKLPVLLNQLITTGLVVAFLTYLIMPRLTQLFRQWLYPAS